MTWAWPALHDYLGHPSPIELSRMMGDLFLPVPSVRIAEGSVQCLCSLLLSDLPALVHERASILVRTVMDLSSLPILYLLVEVLYKGRAGLIAELEQYEPIDPTVLDAELTRRSGTRPHEAIHDWVEWYLNSDQLSESDLNTLKEMRQFKQKHDEFVRRLTNSLR